MRKEINIIAVGGLCNRLMCIASAIELSLTAREQVKVYWNKNHELFAKFSDLFDLDIFNRFKNITIIENTNPLFFNHSKRNLYIPQILQKIKFGNNIYIQPKLGDYKSLNLTGSILLYCHYAFGNHVPLDIFKPTKALQDKINDITNKYDFSNIIGIHIRRTDHVQSIEHASDYNFMKKMDEEIIMNPTVRFYLATDDYNVVNKFIGKYGNRIIHPEFELSRTTTKGMQDAVVDLFCLSNSVKIYGSYYSSYTNTASLLKGSKLQIVGKD